MKLKTLRERVQTSGAKILVYGSPGVGKTHLLGTAPEDARVLFLDADGGLRTLVDAVPDAKVATIEGADDMEAAMSFLEGRGAGEFDIVALDSLSELANIVLREQLPNHKNGMAAYGEMGRIVEAFVGRLKKLPLHVVATASMGEMQDDDGAIWRAPDFPGRYLSNGASALAHKFDYVLNARVLRVPAKDDNGHIVQGKTVVKHALRTAADPGFWIKSRTAGLAPWHKPDLGELLDTIGA